jgi:tight adherence protein B
MSSGWLLMACVAAGALATAWPSGRVRDRLLPRPQRTLALPKLDLQDARQQLVSHPRRSAALIILTAAGAGLLLSGLVAGLLGVVYGSLGARALLRRSRQGRARAARDQCLDDLGALAADLRAGLPPAPFHHQPGARELVDSAAVCAEEGPAERRIAELTTAVWRLAERTGAPAADLVDRIEADARTADSAKAVAAAQEAGVRMSAVILTALPLGGIGAGFVLGKDPLPILLHTLLGGACAVGASLLQAAGLLWTDRLAGGSAQ